MGADAGRGIGRRGGGRRLTARSARPRPPGPLPATTRSPSSAPTARRCSRAAASSTGSRPPRRSGSARSPGVAPRRGSCAEAATRIVRHFADHGVPGPDGLLTLGWHRPWRPLAQPYSGPGSPYWASKGLLGIALPADHPVWTAAPEPLPVDVGDVLAVAAAPGWVVSGTRADGIVRVVNHGTDHALPGSDGRRLAAVRPPRLLDRDDARCSTPTAGPRPLDQSVVAPRRDGQATHRTGFDPLRCRRCPIDAASRSVQRSTDSRRGPTVERCRCRLASASCLPPSPTSTGSSPTRPCRTTAPAARARRPPAGRITDGLARPRRRGRCALVRASAREGEPGRRRRRAAGRRGDGAADRRVGRRAGARLGAWSRCWATSRRCAATTTSDDASPLAGPTAIPWLRYVPVPGRLGRGARRAYTGGAGTPGRPAAASGARRHRRTGRRDLAGRGRTTATLP